VVVGGGGPPSLARGGLWLARRGALDGALLAAEMGAGAVAPGISGKVDGRGDCAGSATAGARGASAALICLRVDRRLSSSEVVPRHGGVWRCCCSGGRPRDERHGIRRLVLVLGRVGQIWAREGSIWA
jgi:hypothetical protein